MRRAWTLLGYVETLPQACRTCRHINIVGRIRRDVSPRQAASRSHTHLPIARRSLPYRLRPAVVRSSPRWLRTSLDLCSARCTSSGPPLALLLVIACANIANLLLIRASEREEEIAIRRALGVSPSRMLRQLLTEAVVLAMAGGAAGVALAWWATALVVANGPADLPRLDEVRVDGTCSAVCRWHEPRERHRCLAWRPHAR